MRGACPLSTLPVMGYLSFRKSISAVDVLLQADKDNDNSKWWPILGDNGETVVQPFEDYDDTYDQIIKNR